MVSSFLTFLSFTSVCCPYFKRILALIITHTEKHVCARAHTHTNTNTHTHTHKHTHARELNHAPVFRNKRAVELLLSFCDSRCLIWLKSDNNCLVIEMHYINVSDQFTTNINILCSFNVLITELPVLVVINLVTLDVAVGVVGASVSIKLIIFKVFFFL